MKIILLYGLTAGIVGLILGGFLLFFLVIGLGFLWKFIFGSSPWPAWTLYVSAMIFAAGCIAVFILEIKFIKKGLAFGKDYAGSEAQKVVWQTAMVYFIASLVALALFVQFVIANVLATQKRFAELPHGAGGQGISLTKANAELALAVKKTEDTLETVITVFKSSMDPHRLTITFLSADEKGGFTHSLYEVSNDVSLYFSKQQFIYDISYAGLLPKFDLPSAAAAIKNIKIQVRLQPSSTDQQQNSSTASSVPINELSVLAKFSIECPNTQCRIVNIEPMAD